MPTRLSPKETYSIAQSAALAYTRAADTLLAMPPAATDGQEYFTHAPLDDDYAGAYVCKWAERTIGQARTGRLTDYQLRKLVKAAQAKLRMLILGGYCHPQGFTRVLCQYNPKET